MLGGGLVGVWEGGVRRGIGEWEGEEEEEGGRRRRRERGGGGREAEEEGERRRRRREDAQDVRDVRFEDCWQ